MGDFLIWIAEFLRWIGGALYGAAAAILSFIDALLNPLLSPLLAFLNPVATFLADCAYAVLGFMPPWLSLIIVSTLMGIATLPVFRYTSNQNAIRRAKDDIKANLLALKLYKDDLRVTLRTQVRLLWAVARLQRYVLTPVLVMILPMMMLLAQVAARHQWRPLAPGERTIMRFQVKDSVKRVADPITAKAVPGVEVELGPLPGPNDVVFRIRAISPGRHLLPIHFAADYDKEVVVGRGNERVNPKRAGADWKDRLLYPVEPALSLSSPVESISVEYPPRKGWFAGSDSWIISLFVVSMLAAFVFRPLFRVTF